MIIKKNIPIYDICWLNYAQGGTIGTYYEPENIDELKGICSLLYQNGKSFDLIGHTSNIYFLPTYNVDDMVSTRKCNQYFVKEDVIICDCGVSVSKLAHQMVNEGIKGFEGLVDLPGTVAASVYGNASCYGCSINKLLVSCKLLCMDGNIVNLTPEELNLSIRSSSLKRGELKGVIISVVLKKEKGNAAIIQQQAEKNHLIRTNTQPGPKDNLGSIYAISDGWSVFSFIPRIFSTCYSLLIYFFSKDKRHVLQKRNIFLLKMLGSKELAPYVYDWNRYIWKDEKAHTLFWKYHKLHQKMFKKSQFEIEIRGEYLQ